MNYKIWIVVIFIVFSTLTVPCRASEYPGEFTKEDIRDLEYLHHIHRPKRSGYGSSSSGSGDILNSIKSAIAASIKKKIGQLARGSAAASGQLAKGVVSASGAFSAGSSGSDSHSYHHYEHPPDSYHDHIPETYDHKSFDFWQLKKSILNTLLQAVKAIKGGVIAIKGQLIKGSGYIVSGSGKLISTKGEAITNLGKNIASSAILVPSNGHHHHSSPGHEEYGPPPSASGHYSAPSAPSDVYHPSGSDYGVPESHHHPQSSNHEAGILILKKITKDNQAHPTAEASADPPSFKPVSPSGPSLSTVVGKFMSASSSLDPHSPQGFGDYDFGHSDHAISHQHPVSHAHESLDNHAHQFTAQYQDSSFEQQYNVPLVGANDYYGNSFDNSGQYLGQESIRNVQAVKITEGEKAALNNNSINSVNSINSNPSNEISSPPVLLDVNPVLPSVSPNAINVGLSNEYYLGPPGHFAEPPSGKHVFDPNKYQIRRPYFRMTKKRPSRTTQTKRKRKNPNLDIVKSISYEIGPNGPKRLT